MIGVACKRELAYRVWVTYWSTAMPRAQRRASELAVQWGLAIGLCGRMCLAFMSSECVTE